MITFSNIVTPTTVRSGDHFAAKQFNRNSFNGLSGPVLNIDFFTMSGPTFSAHPHAGFSAVTYLFEDSEGGFINRDSLGNTMRLLPGSTHWTRASSGVVHEELPYDNSKTVRGLQIFFNLPEEDQDNAPDAFHVSAEKVKTIHPASGITYRESVNGTHVGGKEALSKPALISEIKMNINNSFKLPIHKNFAGVIVIASGQVAVNEQVVKNKQAIAFCAEQESELVFEGLADTSKIVIIAGEKFEQPIYQKGPFITASEERLMNSIKRFQNGEFGELTY